MARATYIYVVQSRESLRVYGTFTVKYECADWLKQLGDLRYYDVVRHADGHPGVTTTWTADFFMKDYRP